MRITILKIQKYKNTKTPKIKNQQFIIVTNNAKNKIQKVPYNTVIFQKCRKYTAIGIELDYPISSSDFRIARCHNLQQCSNQTFLFHVNSSLLWFTRDLTVVTFQPDSFFMMSTRRVFERPGLYSESQEIGHFRSEMRTVTSSF